MNLTISGRCLDVTPALREHVLAKLDRVTRHFDQVINVTIVLMAEKLAEKDLRQKVEVILHVKGRDIFVHQSHEDLYAAINLLMDKLDRQVGRHKGQVRMHRKPSFKRALLWPDGVPVMASKVSVSSRSVKSVRPENGEMPKLKKGYESEDLFFKNIAVADSSFVSPKASPVTTIA